MPRSASNPNGSAGARAGGLARRADLGGDARHHVRPRRHEPEEPRQRRRRRLAPGDEEAEHDVPEHLVVAAGGVVARHEPRQDVVPGVQRRAPAPGTDDVHGERVDVGDGLLQAALGADVEPLLDLP